MAVTYMSIKDVRDNLAEVVARVALMNEEVVVTKFGKAKVKILPVVGGDMLVSEEEKFKRLLKQTAGMWKNRKVDAFKLREQVSSRYGYGKIFT